MSGPDKPIPKRLYSIEETADYLSTSRSALLADQKRVPGHPQSFRHPGRRSVVFDREELDAYVSRIKADYRGEPLPPAPVSARQQFLQDQIAAWCSKQVLVPVEPGSIPAKAAALNEALRMKQDINVEVRFQGYEIERREYRWQPDGRCEVTVFQPKLKRAGRLPKWAKAAFENAPRSLTESET